MDVGQRDDGGLPFPRGIASAEGTLGFVRNARDGIDALRLQDGARLWDVDIAAEPVALADGNLVASRPTEGLPSSLELLLLSVADEGRVARQCRLDFPEGVAVGSGDRRDFQFSTELEGGVL